MTNKINQKYLEKFRKLGLIDEVALRNYYIRKEFNELRGKSIKVDRVFEILSEKYNLSASSINIIVYSNQNL